MFYSFLKFMDAISAILQRFSCVCMGKYTFSEAHDLNIIIVPHKAYITLVKSLFTLIVFYIFFPIS